MNKLKILALSVVFAGAVMLSGSGYAGVTFFQFFFSFTSSTPTVIGNSSSSSSSTVTQSGTNGPNSWTNTSTSP